MTFFSFLLTRKHFLTQRKHLPIIVISFVLVYVVPSEVISIFSSLGPFVSLPSTENKLRIQTNVFERGRRLCRFRINHLISRSFPINVSELNHVERKSEVDFCVCILSPRSRSQKRNSREKGARRMHHVSQKQWKRLFQFRARNLSLLRAYLQFVSWLPAGVTISFNSLCIKSNGCPPRERRLKPVKFLNLSSKQKRNLHINTNHELIALAVCRDCYT